MTMLNFKLHQNLDVILFQTTSFVPKLESHHLFTVSQLQLCSCSPIPVDDMKMRYLDTIDDDDDDSDDDDDDDDDDWLM